MSSQKEMCNCFTHIIAGLSGPVNTRHTSPLWDNEIRRPSAKISLYLGNRLKHNQDEPRQRSIIMFIMLSTLQPPPLPCSLPFEKSQITGR